MARRILTRLVLLLAAVWTLAAASGCGPDHTRDKWYGCFLVYVSEDGLELFRMDTRERQTLIRGAHLFSPHVSPDGTLVYFNNSSDIFCVPVSGGTAALASPDASFLGFDAAGRMLSRSSGGVRAYDPASGVTEILVNAPDNGFVDGALLSPDESRLVFARRYTDVGIDRPDGAYVRSRDLPELDAFSSLQICGRADWLTDPLAWSCDSGAVIFGCGAAGAERLQLFSLPIIEGASMPLGGKTLLLPAGTRLSLSADGTCAAFPAYRSPADELETVCLLDLKTLKARFIPSGYSGVSGVALSSDGSLAAYTSAGAAGGESGFYLYANDTTICVVSGGGRTEYAAPRFASNDLDVIFVGAGERLLAETDRNGNAVGTYTAPVASLYTAVANTSGSTRLVDGLRFPDGVYTDRWEDLYDFYEYDTAGSEAN